MSEALADKMNLQDGTREAFLTKLRGIRKLWDGLQGTRYNDNKFIVRQLESYITAVERAYSLAKQLGLYLPPLEPDPNAGNNTNLDAWLQHPPQPEEYLRQLLDERTDWEATVKARQESGDRNARVYMDWKDCIIPMPKEQAHKRRILLNNLLDLFRIAYPGAEPKLYRDNHNDSGYAGGFYAFLSDVLPDVDDDPALLKTLAERFLKS